MPWWRAQSGCVGYRVEGFRRAGLSTGSKNPHRAILDYRRRGAADGGNERDSDDRRGARRSASRARAGDYGRRPPAGESRATLEGLRAHLVSFYSTIGRPSIDPELLIPHAAGRLLLMHPLGTAAVRGGPPVTGAWRRALITGSDRSHQVNEVHREPRLLTPQ